MGSCFSGTEIPFWTQQFSRRSCVIPSDLYHHSRQHLTCALFRSIGVHGGSFIATPAPWLLDDNDAADDSDTSNIDEISPTSPNARKSGTGAAKTVQPKRVESKRKDEPRVTLSNVDDTDIMLNGLSLHDHAAPMPEIDFDEAEAAAAIRHAGAPVVASTSSAAPLDQQPPLHERRRREHEEYRRKRDEDPAFVPNRGAFFMHDHRHAGPAANGFRPFGRAARARGRGGFGGLYHPMSHLPNFLISPTGSAISRPPMPMDNVVTVRLPPPPAPLASLSGSAASRAPDVVGLAAGETDSKSSINGLPPPQTHPLPQKPTFPENRSTIPMHQPRPQKTVSVGNIECPMQTQADFVHPYKTAFHQQVPPQVSNGPQQESHIRCPSYPQQHSTGTPLSQIPERAIHAAPFQPTAFPQPPPPPQGFYSHTYPMVQNQQAYYYHHQQSYPTAMGPVAGGAPAFVPSGQDPQAMPYAQAPAPEPAAGAAGGGPASGGSRLISQDIGGTMYYFDPSQLPPMATYPPYPSAQGYVLPGYGVNGMTTPNPDVMFYSQPGAGLAGAPDYSQFNYPAPVPGMSSYPQ
ncbi:hypothetical protein P8C59_008514 [Phyllachora maydis]|uniref:Btz domain-containing protein n=1 Tax=Phyllachora maydis TaxID=1825666 RepID=A0AAD9MFA1_9PEZI|nr:hypothetical protein P8C59_008514 [Phyllachora maydis]